MKLFFYWTRANKKQQFEMKSCKSLVEVWISPEILEFRTIFHRFEWCFHVQQYDIYLRTVMKAQASWWKISRIIHNFWKGEGWSGHVVQYSQPMMRRILIKTAFIHFVYTLFLVRTANNKGVINLRISVLYIFGHKFQQKLWNSIIFQILNPEEKKLPGFFDFHFFSNEIS